MTTEEIGFERWLKATKDPVAAAIMCAAKELSGISRVLSDFDHQLLLGSQKLADQTGYIATALSEIADTLKANR